MAESVDALVSNTSGAIHPGSIPGLGTKQAAKRLMFNRFAFFFCQRIGNLAFLLDKLFFFFISFCLVISQKKLTFALAKTYKSPPPMQNRGGANCC